MKLFGIRNGGGYATVSLEGGTVLSYMVENSVIIYPQTTVEMAGGRKTIGGAFICFPLFGPPTSRFSSEISQHGWLRKQGLNLYKEGETSLILSGFRQKAGVYPWRVTYNIEISITSGGELFTGLTIHRLNDGIAGLAPVNPAFHPCFCHLGRSIAIIDGERFVVRSNQRQALPVKGKEILVDMGRRQVKMSLGSDFGKEYTPYVFLWTDSPKYFCIEPILAHPGSFDSPGGKFLKQGETLSLSYSLSVL